MTRRTGSMRIATSFPQDLWAWKELFILSMPGALVRAGKLDAGHCPRGADVSKPEWNHHHSFAARERGKHQSCSPGADH